MRRRRCRKGEYGYRNQRKRDRLLITAAFAAAIAVELWIRSVVSDSTLKTLLTVTAILTVLPMANIASPLLASWKYRTIDRDFYEKTKKYEGEFRILYDLVLTTKEQVIPLDAVIVHPIGVFAFCSDNKLDEKKAEKGLNAIFTGARLDPSIHIIRDPAAFQRRLDSLKPAEEFEDDGVVDYEVRTLCSLCM
ncbi:MAG: O-linked GlcNAc transferase-like protein [Clostridiales bacterium]|nr:O-linked GlcNAc transferase-like protein [Clostridiales bacterium]